MGPRSRREFLKACGGTLPAMLLANGGSAPSAWGWEKTQGAYRTPGTLEPYVDPLPLLKTLAPSSSSRHGVEYRMRMLDCTHTMHSQLPPTRVWGYEGRYPGPTLEALRDVPVLVRWENHLPTQHLLPVDTRIHGAMPPSPAVRTVPHLHGSRTTSESDGLPEKWFTPGSSALYSYPNGQQAATLWYHDHAVGITRLNTYAGLSGFYLLRDDEERAMALPAGDYEIPLLLQDRTLDDAGQLVYAPTHEDGLPLPPGVWGPEFFGELAVVNGAILPFLEVEPRRYRLRVLNGSNSRFLHLFFNLAKSPTDIPSLVSFQQIGSDGGLLGSSVALEKVLLGPAERADLLVDFSPLAGKTVTLSNDAAAPFPGWGMVDTRHAPLRQWMQFRVTLPLSGKEAAFSMPPRTLPKIDETAKIPARVFLLSEQLDDQGKSLGVRIDGKGYDDPVTEFVQLGSVETWQFVNTTDDAHPMHLHLVQFRILRRQGFDPGSLKGGTLRMIGVARRPAPNEEGWKDTAVVHPGEALTILVRFEGYTGRFVFHCHMLEHEDNDMMRPFEVVVAKEASQTNARRS